MNWYLSTIQVVPAEYLSKRFGLVLASCMQRSPGFREFCGFPKLFDNALYMQYLVPLDGYEYDWRMKDARRLSA